MLRMFVKNFFFALGVIFLVALIPAFGFVGYVIAGYVGLIIAVIIGTATFIGALIHFYEDLNQ